MSVQVHELKTEPVYFEATLQGDKPYEIRRNDRGFQVGDHLRLREFDRDTEVYSGRETTVVVTHILDHPRYLPEGYVAMGVRRLDNGVESEGDRWLIAQARVCYELAKARGKYHERPSGIEIGIGQIQQELLEWLVVSTEAIATGEWMFDHRRERIYEEAGDALHALLSVMVSEFINPAKALADAQERNRKRAEEGSK